VESQLLHALTKTCLITDRDSCGIVCGGRTDKGVSALGQVVSLRVRSNLPHGEGMVGIVPPPSADAAAPAIAVESACAAEPKRAREELDYCRILNRVLPSDIRILSWRPVDESFSARFSAKQRTYKYFFARASLDVGAMREAAAQLVGEHDLRNFCKIDPSVTNFTRRILSFGVDPCDAFGGGGVPADHPQSMWCFTVRGSAFLYHQVRCMVAVLFLVGERKEAPTIVSQLLDLQRFPRRPNYEMASEAPLLFYNVEYDSIPDWEPDAKAQLAICELWGEQQRSLMLRSAMLHTMRASLTLPEGGDAAAVRASYGTVGAGEPRTRSQHVPLATRPTHESVEVRTKGKAK
jgi:tRNA pseudouridine38/39 synthase